MRVKPNFSLPRFDTWAKELSLGYLGAVSLTVDYDDVDHYEVEELLPLVVWALNTIPPEEIKAAVKRARDRHKQEQE